MYGFGKPDTRVYLFHSKCLISLSISLIASCNPLCGNRSLSIGHASCDLCNARRSSIKETSLQHAGTRKASNLDKNVAAFVESTYWYFVLFTEFLHYLHTPFRTTYVEKRPINLGTVWFSSAEKRNRKNFADWLMYFCVVCTFPSSGSAIAVCREFTKKYFAFAASNGKKPENRKEWNAFHNLKCERANRLVPIPETYTDCRLRTRKTISHSM